MSNTAIVKEISINAPAARVWEAITSKEEMSKWGFDIKEFEPVVGYEFTFLGGKDDELFLHICVVKEVIENKKLAYTWSYEKMPGIETLVTFELIEEGLNKTKVRLTHEGVDEFPQDQNFARGNFEMGWTEICKLLKQHVEEA